VDRSGPSGKTPTAIGKARRRSHYSFEDTKVFGPGTSFAFTLEEGTGLFRANPPFGEWHMHCHVPMHMMSGMAGSLLVIKGGELAMPLPEGQGCPPDPPEPDPPREPQTFDVHITATEFKPSKVFLVAGDSVRWINDAQKAHGPKPPDGSFKGNALSPTQDYTEAFPKPGIFPYNCIYRDHTHNAGDITGPMVVVSAHPIGITGGASPPGASAPTPSPVPAAGSTMHDVSIGVLGFSPGTVSIKVGDSVRWTNNDTTPHTATGDDHSWGSPTLPSGKTFFRTFTSKGSVGSHCHIHHEMVATVVVT
jgi:plastocyanin